MSDCCTLCSDFSANEFDFIGTNEFINKSDAVSNYLMEYLLELTRRSFFPNLPSRFTSLFCLERLEDINLWKDILGEEFNIFVIQTETKQKVFDANFLHMGLCRSIDESTFHYGFSSRLNYHQAYNYWSGLKGDNPLKEVIIPLPITIGKQVTNYYEQFPIMFKPHINLNNQIHIISMNQASRTFLNSSVCYNQVNKSGAKRYEVQSFY